MRKTIPIIGYADKLSIRPGESVAFKVSSLSNKNYKASLIRTISADPNPQGLGLVEEFIESNINGEYPSRKQSIYPGSYIKSNDQVDINLQQGLHLNLHFLSTLKSEKEQVIFSFDEFKLYINSENILCAEFFNYPIEINHKLTLNNWYQVHFAYNTISQQANLSLTAIKSQITSEKSINISLTTQQLKLKTFFIAAAWQNKNAQICNHFNGKIENPAVYLSHLADNNNLLFSWNFSKDIDSNTIVDIEQNVDAKTFNIPTRAIKSSQWDGTEMNYKHKLEHYQAIHFHEDDIYDFNWENDFVLHVTDEMRSGFYAIKLECEGHYDKIPFFICAKKNRSSETKTAKLCVIVPSFTYVIYGNHKRPDYNNHWIEKTEKSNAYPHNPYDYDHFGLSTYNNHKDGSGICYAYHKRPLLNLRPGYITFGNTDCSGLRHLPADTHLISWLENKNIDYDILTDQELHDEGNAALSAYNTIITTTHPEYHTERSLNTFQEFQKIGGNIIYLGGNGFYWKIVENKQHKGLLEIRRAEGGIRAWAAEPGEYYHSFATEYGGLWRRNGRAPQRLVGVGFSAQGPFISSYYKLVSSISQDKISSWLLKDIEDEILGDFGFSGNGAAGYELDSIDYSLGSNENIISIATSENHHKDYILAHEEQLTHITNLKGDNTKLSLHADIVYYELENKAKVFSTGSITFCGSLPSNHYNNNISTLLYNVITHFNPQ